MVLVASTYKIKLPSPLYEPEFFSKAEYEARTCVKVAYWGSDLRAGGRDGGMWKRVGGKANTKVHWSLPWATRVPLILHPAGAFWGVSRMPFRIHTNREKHFLWALSFWWGSPQEIYIPPRTTHPFLGYIGLRAEWSSFSAHPEELEKIQSSKQKMYGTDSWGSISQHKTKQSSCGTVSWSRGWDMKPKRQLIYMTYKAFPDFPFYSSSLISGHRIP